MKNQALLLTLVLALGSIANAQTTDYSALVNLANQWAASPQTGAIDTGETATQKANREATAAYLGVNPNRCNSLWSIAEQRYITTCQ